MQKRTHKLLALVLSVIFVVSIMSVATFTVNAATSHTQAEAVEWIKARGNESWWQDVDGAYGCQCVDLVKAYYQYFGYGFVYGNAGDYISDHLPPGSDWYYSNTPVAGCVFVKGYSSTYTYGHVGLVYAVEGSTILTVETNVISPYDGGANSSAQFRNRPLSFATTYIIPTFKNPHTHSYGAWQTVKAATCTTDGTKKRTCSCGDTQTDTIPKTGHKWDGGVVAKAATCETSGTKLYTCTSCKTTRTESILPLHHLYFSVTIPATCTADAYKQYTCLRCNKEYTEPIVTWSSWSTDTPPKDAINTQTKKQYRSKTKETSVGTAPTKSGWDTDGTTWVKKSSGTHAYFARPGGFNSGDFTEYASAQKSATTSSTTKTEVSTPSHKSYIYWHWAYPYTYGNGGNTYIGDYYGDTWKNYDGAATVWEAFESATDIREHTYSDGCVQVSGHSNYSYNWFITEVKQQTYTTYEKQYQYSRWTDWSSWRDNIILKASNNQVETRTLYRYQFNDSKAKGHIPEEAVKENEKAATYTDEGSYDSVVYCKTCGTEISRRTISVPVLIKTYEITYILNGGKGNTNPTTYTVNSADITLKSPTKKGYTFKGWYDGSAKVTKIAKGTTGNITLTAKWRKNIYNITYKLNNGTNNKNNPKTYTVTTSAITLKNPTRKGYTFKGWYNGVSKVITIKKGSTGDITLTAKWSKKTYKVTY
ncbi:MAG: InlB B-repeat-containing protein, partial [Clostridia bacterium]|nr:InlB B-repeat-containing protein [Clostridia bacterium]